MNTKILGASLLVTGTTVGAGMLALPVVTGLAGFIPAIVLLLTYWLFMTYTAFLLVETTLWFPKDTNLITMSKHTLGRAGQMVTWVVYLFLLYALTTAYMAGCSPLFLDFIEGMLGSRPEHWVGYLPLIIIFGFFIYRGYAWVDHVNRVMMIGMLITFLVIIFSLAPEVEMPLLSRSDWSSLPIALSLVATSFGFHIIIPSLSTYLDHDATSLKKAIWIGSIIPVIGYIIWEWLSLGIVPAEYWGNALETGETSGKILFNAVAHPYLRITLRFFSFFTIVTSFLGVSLSLFDFLADGLKIQKNHLGRGGLYLLTFGPPLVVSLNNPKAFLIALDYAGAFGVVIILAIVPAAMIYFGRPKYSKTGDYKVKGGILGLALVLLLSLIVIIHEIYAQWS